MTIGHAQLDEIPATLASRGARRFWAAVVFIGVGTGVSAGVLTRVLEWVEAFVWRGSAHDTLVEAVSRTSAIHRVVVLVAAGAITGLGQIVLRMLSSGNGIDVTEAILFHAGRLPRLRTVASAILSVVIVAMGCSLGREGAPKQVGAVLANVACDRLALSDEQRRLLVACGSGAGMAGAYGVPVGGALFALEVMRGLLALRLVLPALLASILASAVAWWFLPNAPTYVVREVADTLSFTGFAAIAGPLAGVASVAYVRLVTTAHRHRPAGHVRVVAPVAVFALLGVMAIAYPHLLGNGKDIVQDAFSARLAPVSLLALLALKPLATSSCLGSGAPGGLFTSTMSFGALLGAVLGVGWAHLAPGADSGACAIVIAAAVLGATTQGPLSAIVLVMELIGRDRSYVVPMIVAVVLATLVSRSIEPRSIYDARLTDEQVRARRAPPKLA